MPSSNQQIVEILRKVATVYILTDKNRFRIIAYQKAADTVENMEADLYQLYKEDKLGSASGLGSTIASHIDEYFRKKTDCYLLRTIRQIPSVVFDLMQVPGIGPKKAYKLINILKLQNSKNIYEAIRRACLADKIAPIESFGQKSQSDILHSVDLFAANQNKPKRLLLHEAEEVAGRIIEYMKKDKNVYEIIAMGSLRRRKSTIGDIDFAVVLQDFKKSTKVLDYFVKYPQIASVENKGGQKCAVILNTGLRVDVRLAGKNNIGAMLQYFTGSKEHNIKLREYGQKKGYSLSEYGIKITQNLNVKFENQNLKLKTFESEKKFYEYLGLQYIPPEIREGTDEIEIAKKNKIPKLISLSDVKGDLQIHSNYDIQPSHDLGQSSCEQILQKADEKGYQYVAFTDHNPSISNHTEEQIVQIIRTRQKYLSSISNKKFARCKLFNSLEVDIRPDGQISIPIPALAFVDFILVSIHSSFTQPADITTERIIKALHYPKVKIFAHPTGRLINRRASVLADWTKIFKVCSDKKIAVEINGSPARLDLPDQLVREAKKYNVLFSLGTDSHQKSQMDLMPYAVDVARRGWLCVGQTINTWDYEKIRKFLVTSK